MRRLRLVSVLVALALFAVACGGGDTTATAASSDDASVEMEGAFTTVSGGQLELEGQDTVLWFWAPW